MQKVVGDLLKCLEVTSHIRLQQLNSDDTTKPFQFGNGKRGTPHSKKGHAFTNLKKEANSDNTAVKKIKKKRKHAREHGKKIKKEYYISSNNGSSSLDGK